MTLTSLRSLAAAPIAFLLLTSSGFAQTNASNVEKGRQFAQENCSRCHAIDKAGASPNKDAPPFRTLHLRYPVESLEESLAEGIYTGHPIMPEFQLKGEQIGNLIAFLKSLE